MGTYTCGVRGAGVKDMRKQQMVWQRASDCLSPAFSHHHHIIKAAVLVCTTHSSDEIILDGQIIFYFVLDALNGRQV
jgi:hypothetical protein